MIAIFGMTDKCHDVLKELINKFGPSFIEVVINATDKNVQNDFSDEIKELCSSHAIRCVDRSNDYGQIKSLYAFAISWRWLIHLEESKKLIVFHDSLLPAYRGFAPLVNMLIQGETKIGVTGLFASEEYDKGDIICQYSSDIEYPLRIKDAIDIVKKNYVAAALHIAQAIYDKRQVDSKMQKETDATYSLWRDDDDYRIDWSSDAEHIKRFVDATGYPYKGASAILEGKLIRIYEATVMEDLKVINRDVGKVININSGKPVVICGKGLLRLDEAVSDNGSSILPLKKFRSRFQ